MTTTPTMRGWIGLTRGAVALAALLAPAGLSGCDEGEANQNDLVFDTSAVERRTLVSSVEATGTIEPIRVIDVKSQASGEILAMPVDLGDRVERGELLVRIDPRDVRNAYDQAQADLDVARAREEVARRRLERAQILRDSAVVTDEELETALLSHADAKAALVRAEANMELAEDRLEDVTVRAPLTGTVVEKSVEEGTVVSSTRDVTGGTTLLRMADLGEVQVRTLVDETDIGRITAGLPAEITVEAYPDRTFRGEVLKIEPQAVVEQNVTMFAVLTRIENEDRLLKPGMNADVEVVLGRREDVLALPNAAVKTPEEARRLAGALGLEIDPPGRRPSPGSGGPGGTADESAGASPTSAGEGEMTPERFREMSRDERREHLEDLPADERRRLFRAMRGGGGPEAAASGDPARPKPGYVFRYGPGGTLTLEPVVVGLSSWDYTEIVDGLGEGDAAVEVPLSLIQQQELLQRIRDRSGVPGVSRG